MLDPVLLDGFMHRLYAVRAVHLFSVTSWGRTPWRNKAVGGMAGSKHLDWLAVDLVPDPSTNRHRLFVDLREVGLVVIDEGDHFHVQATNPPSGLLAPFKAPALPAAVPVGGLTQGGVPLNRPEGPPIQSEKT
jgi:hypothetical protein